jgi:hypothetical protein
VGGILLLLFKPGNLSFIEQVIIPPSGNSLIRCLIASSTTRSIRDLTAAKIADLAER